jgi:hypothetical protein
VKLFARHYHCLKFMCNFYMTCYSSSKLVFKCITSLAYYQLKTKKSNFNFFLRQTSEAKTIKMLKNNFMRKFNILILRLFVLITPAVSHNPLCPCNIKLKIFCTKLQNTAACVSPLLLAIFLKHDFIAQVLFTLDWSLHS